MRSLSVLLIVALIACGAPAQQNTKQRAVIAAPQLDNRAAFLKYLRGLNPDERVTALKKQIAKYPSSPLRTKAIEEIAWLTDGRDDAALKSLRSGNVTAEIFRVRNLTDRQFGISPAPANLPPPASVAEVVARYRKASAIDSLLSKRSLQIVTSYPRAVTSSSSCLTDGRNMRSESAQVITLWAQNRNVTYSVGERKIVRDAEVSDPAYNIKENLFDLCLQNFPDALKWPQKFTFGGRTTFNGVAAYELKQGQRSEFFDAKTYQLLGFIYHGQSDVVSVLGTYRIIGGSVFPTTRVTGNLAGASFSVIEAVRLDVPIAPGLFEKTNISRPMLAKLEVGEQTKDSPGSNALPDLENAAAKAKRTLTAAIPSLGLEPQEFSDRLAFANVVVSKAIEIRQGLAADKQSAGNYYLAMLNSPETQAAKASIYYNRKDYALALQWYRKAADQGHATSANNLGEMYDAGKGTARDDSAAESWYRRAIQLGNTKARRNLEMLLSRRQREAQAEAEARQREAAEAEEAEEADSDSGSPSVVDSVGGILNSMQEQIERGNEERQQQQEQFLQNYQQLQQQRRR